MVNLKHELNKMKVHREKYFPVVKYLLEVHGQKDEFKFPMEIEDTSDMLIMLELIDLGYLEKNCFIIKRDFMEITGLFFRGQYPLTVEGELVFTHSQNVETNYRKIIAYFLAIVLLIALFLKFLFWA